MNVLLLLSALLSALTGVNAGARAPVAAAQVSVQAVTAAVLATPSAIHVPAQTLDPLAARRTAVPLVRLPHFDLPAYASRRRE